MSDAQHTAEWVKPIPFKADSGSYNIFDATGGIVASLDLRCVSDERKATAEFIVRACNSHADLLAALEVLERAIANNEPFSRAEHEQAKAAIAAARGQ